MLAQIRKTEWTGLGTAKVVIGQLKRFSGVGIFNTVLGYGLYAFFHLFFDYATAYSLSVLIGVALSFVLNTKLVFQTKLSCAKCLRFVLVCLAQYGIGLMALKGWVEYVGVDDLLAPLLVLALTIPLGFAGFRWALMDKKMA
ncbi:GtrA family protein [Grimontia sp. S25]|uniref:GtrA family protein n=1 Tax=Grimontia sedimenti TaxID=2711294 RepID=A0A6M1RRW2_9GAMM|nr:GtrA family protein [Grimontia sedimenti]NGN98757.1 GtrA family protein [Grimontia sedimenti]